MDTDNVFTRIRSSKVVFYLIKLMSTVDLKSYKIVIGKVNKQPVLTHRVAFLDSVAMREHNLAIRHLVKDPCSLRVYTISIQLTINTNLKHPVVYHGLISI